MQTYYHLYLHVSVHMSNDYSFNLTKQAEVLLKYGLTIKLVANVYTSATCQSSHYRLRVQGFYAAEHLFSLVVLLAFTTESWKYLLVGFNHYSEDIREYQ